MFVFVEYLCHCSGFVGWENNLVYMGRLKRLHDVFTVTVTRPHLAFSILPVILLVYPWYADFFAPTKRQSTTDYKTPWSINEINVHLSH